MERGVKWVSGKNDGEAPKRARDATENARNKMEDFPGRVQVCCPGLGRSKGVCVPDNLLTNNRRQQCREWQRIMSLISSKIYKLCHLCESNFFIFHIKNRVGIPKE